MTNPFLNIWAPFTDAEREIILGVFAAYMEIRTCPMQSAIAEDILHRLIVDLVDFQAFENECKARQEL